MSSGMKKMIIGSRERAVSTDIVRLQSFQHAAIGEALRHLLLSATSEGSSGGVATVPSAAASPMAAIILAGFLCRPQLSTDANPQDLYVDGGELVAIATDAAPDTDDSIAKVVRDPAGMTTPGAVQFLAVGAATRIDVVELAWVDSTDPSTIVESASRDIYNPTAGAFASAVVPKAREGKLQYRIRRGAEGSGFPGTASGWLPLMVAIVPVGATNWDGVACYDVRPLLADRANVGNLAPSKNEIVDAELVAGFAYEANAGTATRKTINGRVSARYGGSIVGGALPAGGLDLSTNDYAVANFISAMTDGWWNLYLAFPGGLPRWARYAAAPSPRLPSMLRGIPVATQQACDVTGAPAAAIALPSNLGFGGATTTAAVRVFTAPCKAVQKLIPTAVDGSGWYSTAKILTAPTVATGVNVSSGTVWQFDLVEGTHVPIGCKAVELANALTWTPANGVTYAYGHVEQYVESSATFVGDFDAVAMHSGGSNIPAHGDGSTPVTTQLSTPISLAPSWPGAASSWSAHTWHLGALWRHGSGSVTLAGAVTIEVRRYRL